ncbi:MAG: hybrid sensor histidine kinase/response regulator [Bacteroidales bacterium]|nr:hybrid sensor histidine kinase/response regulator [Bacteroidales bacterium]
MENANPKILLVDDNPINIRVAAKILRSNNYNISFSQSGPEAIQKAGQIDFDLVLLDIMMPDMDGYEVCKRLKENPETMKVPIIFLTAKTESENVVRAFELGGADYVTKPFNGKELLSRVETHIRLKRSREALEDTNLKLIESNETKDKMFSIISHDLLGPVGNIKESLEMIANNEVEMDDESMQDFIRATWYSVGNAYALLENLLYWARNQQGRMVYNPKKLLLNKVIFETYGLLAGVAKNKNIELRTNLIREFEAYADKNAIKTILRNLISNALKFTNPGGKITSGVRDTDEKFLSVFVKDNGIGMDQDKAVSLFDSKQKNEPGWGTKGEKGVGLGLVICKEFVEKHGGKIWVDSQPGLGSTFNFTIPKYSN